VRFFNDAANWDKVYPYLNGERMSRRFLEHFVTEYARAYRCEYYLTDPSSGERYLFNVYHAAQTVLLGVHKRHMDPFSRKNRSAQDNGFFVFGHGDKKCEVTVCELVFFRWALKKGVLAYAEEHEAEIKEDMAKIAKLKRTVLDSRRHHHEVEEVVIELPSIVGGEQPHPLRDQYWQSATEEKKLQPRKERKRYRQSTVGTLYNENIAEVQTFT